MLRSRVGLGPLFVLAVFLSGGALPAFASTAAQTPETAVQVPERLCAAAVPGRMSCDAIGYRTRLVSSAEARKLHAAGVARPAVPSSVGAGPRRRVLAGPARDCLQCGPRPRRRPRLWRSSTPTADPSVTADLDAFDAELRSPGRNFLFVSGREPDRRQSVSGINSDVGWAGEITLDVDAAPRSLSRVQDPARRG